MRTTEQEYRLRESLFKDTRPDGREIATLPSVRGRTGQKPDRLARKFVAFLTGDGIFLEIIKGS